MSTGREHYRVAEELIGRAQEERDRNQFDEADRLIRAAQVHALLAAAGAASEVVSASRSSGNARIAAVLVSPYGSENPKATE